MEPLWHILHFHGYNPNNIIDISERLQRRFGEDNVFCPIVKERKYNGKKRIFYEVDTPLFLGYVFLKVPFDPGLEQVIEDHIARRYQFLTFQEQDEWAHVNEEEINALKREHSKLIDGEEVINTALTVNDVVRFKSGSFENFAGKVVAISTSKSTAKVITDVFNKPTLVETPINSLEKVVI